MTYKPFSKELYEKYDALGKQMVKSFMIQNGYTFVNDEEAYKSHDIVFSKNGDEIRVEVQVCTSWNTLKFPYPTMNMPIRKKHNTCDLFVTVSKSGSSLIIIPMETMLNSPIITKNTCYTNGEKFFNAPQSLARQYFYNDGIWCNIEDDQIARFNF